MQQSQAEDETEQRLNASPPELVVGTPEKEQSPQSKEDTSGLAPGDVIANRYKIVELIGQGGTGAVYKVRHCVLDRILALKVLHPAKVNKDSLLRFAQESKLISSLNHPNVIKVHDFATTDGGLPYMVIDYLEGQSLINYVKTHKPSLMDLSKILAQVCYALEHAHENGIVHRDIKPSNVLVSVSASGSPNATVLDFGIAKSVAGSVTEDHSLTRTGDVFGTPLYMSPEQCLGQPVDERADIYSLGCLMYEAITGLTPFNGDSSFAIVHKQINEAPPRFPHTLSGSKQGRQLESIVLKCLAKDPLARYGHVIQVAADLTRLEEDDTDSLVGGLASSILLAMRRMQATTVHAVRERIGLNLLPLVVFPAVAAIMYLPLAITTLNFETVQLDKVSQLVDTIHENQYSVGDQFEPVQRRMARLQPSINLCHQYAMDCDPILAKSFQKWDSDTAEMVENSIRFQDDVKGNLALSPPEFIFKFTTQLPGVENSFLQVQKSGTELKTAMLQKSFELHSKLANLSWTFLICFVAGILAECLLGFILFKRISVFMSMRRPRENPMDRRKPEER